MEDQSHPRTVSESKRLRRERRPRGQKSLPTSRGSFWRRLSGTLQVNRPFRGSRVPSDGQMASTLSLESLNRAAPETRTRIVHCDTPALKRITCRPCTAGLLSSPGETARDSLPIPYLPLDPCPGLKALARRKPIRQGV